MDKDAWLVAADHHKENFRSGWDLQSKQMCKKIPKNHANDINDKNHLKVHHIRHFFTAKKRNILRQGFFLKMSRVLGRMQNFLLQNSQLACHSSRAYSNSRIRVKMWNLKNEPAVSCYHLVLGEDDEIWDGTKLATKIKGTHVQLDGQIDLVWLKLLSRNKNLSMCILLIS